MSEKQISEKLRAQWEANGWSPEDIEAMAKIVTDTRLSGPLAAAELGKLGFFTSKWTVNRWRQTEVFTEHAIEASQRSSRGRSRRSDEQQASKPIPTFKATPGVAKGVVKYSDGRRAEVDISNGDAADMLMQRGFDPSQWEITKLRMSNWEVVGHGEQTSTKVELERKLSVEQINAIRAIDVSACAPTGPAGNGGVLMISDLQLGKWEDDPHFVTERTLRCVAEALRWLAPQIDSDEGMTLSWLGDNVEGFQSQGGKNIFRTTLPLATQHQMAVELQRAVTRSALAMVDGPVTNVCVPSNHGEIHRVNGGGTTTYTDSWDIVAAQTLADLFDEEERVEVVVPEEDGLICYTSQSRTNLMHLHGHQVNQNKAHEWWAGQAMSSPAAASADIGLAAHNHHFFTSMRNGRLWIQTGACEARSTWFKNRTGVIGDPGIVALVVADGQVKSMRFVQPDWA